MRWIAKYGNVIHISVEYKYGNNDFIFLSTQDLFMPQRNGKDKIGFLSQFHHTLALIYVSRINFS